MLHEIKADSLDRLPKRPTEKLYAYRMTDGSLAQVWADNHLEAEELIDIHSPAGVGVRRENWAWTSGSITYVPSTAWKEGME